MVHASTSCKFNLSPRTGAVLPNRQGLGARKRRGSGKAYVFERPTATGSGCFSFLGSGCALIIVSIRVTTLRACLHGGGGPQVGEVTRPAVVKKWPAFNYMQTYNPGVPG